MPAHSQNPGRLTASEGVGATPMAANQQEAAPCAPWIGFWNLYSHRGSEGVGRVHATRAEADAAAADMLRDIGWKRKGVWRSRLKPAPSLYDANLLPSVTLWEGADV